MRVTRIALSSTSATKAYALDLEFVKCGGRIYARSAAFVPFCRFTEAKDAVSEKSRDKGGVVRASKDNSSANLPQLTELLDRPIVLELMPEMTLQLAEPLPCGHLLREMVDARFALTPALAALVQRFQTEAQDELDFYRHLRKALRESKNEEKRREKNGARKARNAENDEDTTAEATAVGADSGDRERDLIDVEEEENNEEMELPFSTSAPPVSPISSFPSTGTQLCAGPTSLAENMVMRSLQMRAGLVRHFRGLDPHGIPNIKRFDKNALELLYTAPVDSRDFKEASRHLQCLRSVGRGKSGYKGLAFCSKVHPAFIQGVLRTVFENSAAWYEWLTMCYTRVEANLHEVRNAHCAGTHGLVYPPHLSRHMNGSSSSSANTNYLTLPYMPSKHTVEFTECTSLEELGTKMSAVWGELLRENETTIETNPTNTGRRGDKKSVSLQSQTQPPKVFVYGSADLGVIHATLALSTQPLRLNLSERGYKAGRLRARRPTQTSGAGAADTPTPSSSPSTSTTAPSTSVANQNSTPDSARIVSPYEARVVDITKHPLFTASGFATSPKQTPSLSMALERAAARDLTAAALHTLSRQHDPLWDAQALACLCATAGVVR